MTFNTRPFIPLALPATPQTISQLDAMYRMSPPSAPPVAPHLMVSTPQLQAPGVAGMPQQLQLPQSATPFPQAMMFPQQNQFPFAMAQQQALNPSMGLPPFQAHPAQQTILPAGHQYGQAMLQPAPATFVLPGLEQKPPNPLSTIAKGVFAGGALGAVAGAALSLPLPWKMIPMVLIGGTLGAVAGGFMAIKKLKSQKNAAIVAMQAAKQHEAALAQKAREEALAAERPKKPARKRRKKHKARRNPHATTGAAHDASSGAAHTKRKRSRRAKKA